MFIMYMYMDIAENRTLDDMFFLFIPWLKNMYSARVLHKNEFSADEQQFCTVTVM